MAKIMVDELKDRLALPIKNSSGKQLPSPKELMKKVLIKGKRLSNANEDQEEDDKDDEEDDENEAGDLKSIVSSSDVNSKNEMDNKSLKKAQDLAKKVHPDLSAITYLGTGKVKSFANEISSKIPCDMMASYSEGKVTKFLKSSEKTNGWIEHNQNHLR